MDRRAAGMFLAQTPRVKETSTPPVPSAPPPPAPPSREARTHARRLEAVEGDGAQELAPARTRGRTHIEDEVVSVIARSAAENVPGVHRLGGSSLRGLLSRFQRSAGIESEVGFEEAALDIEIVVELGAPIRQVTQALRERVIEAVETTAGRRVVEVNVFVVDVHLPRIDHRPRRELA